MERVLIISIIAGSATGIGSIPILFIDRITHRTYDSMIALAAGIMTGASIFTLIMPGLNSGTMKEIIPGIITGGLFLLLVDRMIPEIDDRFRGGHLTDLEKRAMLIGGSITLHNVPEGLAIGIAFGSGIEGVGFAIALAIGIQNIPDGFAFAIPAEKAGVPRGRNMLYTTLSGGLPEPVAALIGFGLVKILTEIFPIAAGFAAGAMLGVVFKEMIPESHGHDYSSIATAMFLVGFVVMMFIDKTFTV